MTDDTVDVEAIVLLRASVDEKMDRLRKAMGKRLKEIRSEVRAELDLDRGERKS